MLQLGQPRASARPGPGGRWALKTWEKINERVRELPPEQQQQVLDYVDFLRTRGAPAVPAPDAGTAASWPGTRFAAEENLRGRDADRPSSIDDFLVPPPRRHAGPILLGVVLLLAVVAVGGFLYYRYVWSAPGPSDDATAPAAATADAAPAVVAARAGTEEDATPTGAALADAAAPDAPPPAVPPLRLTLGGPPDVAAPAAPDVAAGPATEADLPAPGPEAGTPPPAAPAIPATGAACAAALDEARGLWRRRRQEEALQKLREAIACDPANLEPRLQWGRWFVDSAAAPRNREAVAEGAALLQPAAEAHPQHGELWFHYTNLLFGARQREAALAAREHCLAIRPADEYSASCRFLPQ